jgi:hypothetical protein
MASPRPVVVRIAVAWLVAGATLTLIAGPAGEAAEPPANREPSISPGPGRQQKPVEVFVGVYLYAISELDLSTGTYVFDGYLWFRWKGPAVEEEGIDFVLVNGSFESIDEAEFHRSADGWNRRSHRFAARLRGNFVLHDYPFDTQKLRLVLEHRTLGADELLFRPDVEALPTPKLAEYALDRNVKLGNWRIDAPGVTHFDTVETYRSNFGVITDRWKRASSRYVFEAPVRRCLLPYVIKFVVPLVIIVMMSFSAFFIHATEFEPQVAIAITALLSCIAFHIAQSNSLPRVGYLVAADKFFLLSYVVVFLTLVETIVSNTLFHNGQSEWSDRLDRISRVLFPLVFFVPTALLLLFHG